MYRISPYHHMLSYNGQCGSVNMMNLVVGSHWKRNRESVRCSYWHFDGHLINVDFCGMLDGHLRSHFGDGTDGCKNLLFCNKNIHRGSIAGRDGCLEVQDGRGSISDMRMSGKSQWSWSSVSKRMMRDVS